MGKKTNYKNTDKNNDKVNKTHVSPVSDNTAKKTNASEQQPVKNSVKIDSKQTQTIQKEQLKTSGMILRSYCKHLKNYNGMQLRSHPTIEFKHLD